MPTCPIKHKIHTIKLTQLAPRASNTTIAIFISNSISILWRPRCAQRATAAAGAPAGVQENDEREEELFDALRSRLVAWPRRRRSICRSRFPSLTISFLTVAGAFCQSPGFTQNRGRDEALWLWSRLSCPPRRLWLWSRRLWLRPRRHDRFVRLACAPSWWFLS